jgi:serine/threonine-protein kinase
MADESTARRGEARVGTILKGKYKLDRLIGYGGMASVYEATHRNGNRVAVKVLHPELSVDPEMCARFLREGYVANKVGHEGAVLVLDDDRADDGAVFLVMELLEGETLEARWERWSGKLPLSELGPIAHQLLDVLAAAHEKQIVHRDVKPENTFITKKGAIKVLDFGIARLLENADAATATRTGRALGTPAFMSPEQARGRVKEIDAQTDIWSVGATLFTLISGRLVHEAETASEVLISAATTPSRSLASVAPEVPTAVVAVVDRALAYEKKNRWPSARAMQAALDQAVGPTATEHVVVQTADSGSKVVRSTGDVARAASAPDLEPTSFSASSPMGMAPTPLAFPPPAVTTTVGLTGPKPTAVGTAAIELRPGKKRRGRGYYALVTVLTTSGLLCLVLAMIADIVFRTSKRAALKADPSGVAIAPATSPIESALPTASAPPTMPSPAMETPEPPPPATTLSITKPTGKTPPRPAAAPPGPLPKKPTAAPKAPANPFETQ